MKKIIDLPGKVKYPYLLRLLLLMKLTTFIILISVLNVLAGKSYSQTKSLTLKMEDVSIREVLSKIEDQSEFYFMYSGKIIDVDKNISINVSNQKIEKVLDLMFAGTNVGYAVKDRIIVLTTPELGYADVNFAVTQQRTVSGKVTDERNQPLPGVTIVVKGTTQGTITNSDGEYNLTNVSDNAILVYSFVGMKSQDVAVGTRTSIDVVLQADIIGIEEVVAIGYGTQRKADLTGSVANIKMEDKETVANITLYTALKGTTAGVNVGGEGLAGDAPDLSVRGKTSLSATDAPLVVLDGIIYYGSITDININDVESVDILKDASAAAVYGSRSANGVILITTKKGKSEKPLFNVNAYYGFQDYTNSPERVMNGDEFAIRLVDFYYQQELYRWYQTNPVSDAGKPVRSDVSDRNVVAGFIRTEEEKINYLANKEVDWMKEVEQTAPIQNYDISVSGRTELTNYYLSLSYTDQKGRLLNDQFKRNTLHVKLENKIADWITIGLNTSFSSLDYSGIAASFSDAMLASPLVNMTTPDGKYPIELAKETTHPLQYTVIDNDDKRENLFLSGFAKIKIPKIEGLEYEFNYANTRYSRKNATYYPKSTSAGSAAGGDARKDHTNNISWIINNILTYSKIFADNHSVNATLLYSRENRQGDDSNLRATSFDNELLGYNGMELGTIPSLNTGAWEENSLSYMARVNYSYNSRYLLTGTIRKDGFSGFGPNRKTATFPSLSLGWVISKESFFSNLNAIDLLKIRTSVGKNGNQGIGRYSSFSKMATNAYAFGSQTAIAIYPNTLGNADLGWESTLSYNIGIDYGVLNSRIYGAIDMYKSVTSDVLVRRTIPGSTGYSSVWTNLSAIDNKGIELSINSVNINKELKWETGFVFSLNRDKITKLYGGGYDRDIGNSWFVGEPINSIYSYKVNPVVWTEEEFYRGDIKIPGMYPGHYKVEDLNGDNDIDPDNDRTIVGYEDPNYRFSLTNNLSFKNFNLYVFINSIQGGNGYYLKDNARAVFSCPNLPESADAGIQYVYRQNLVATRQYWTPDNGVKNAPALYYLPRREHYFFQDRSFVRLQDVSLSYDFNKNFLETYKIDGLRVYLSGKNIYTWTNWEGWDPELGENYTRMMRSVILGVRLSF